VVLRLLATLVGTSATPFQREDAAGAEAAPRLESALCDAQPGAPVPLAELYDSHANFVYRSLLGLGVAPARAEDAMQDVFIIANQHLASFKGAFYKAWLFRIAHSVARNVRRAARRAQAEPLEDHSASPFELAAQAQQVRLLNELLEQLKEQQREVFVLAELEQLPHTEIAKALGIHVNTVANRLNAARSRLERFLRNRQGLPGPGRKP
jgi:RNA polymerase sigma-70 factor, ECF subfamily